MQFVVSRKVLSQVLPLLCASIYHEALSLSDHDTFSFFHLSSPVMLYASMLFYVLYVYGDKALGYIITHHRW